MQRKRGHIEELFADLLVRAKEAGELAPGAEPRSLARLVSTTTMGLAVRSKLGIELDEVDDIFLAIERAVAG